MSPSGCGPSSRKESARRWVEQAWPRLVPGILQTFFQLEDQAMGWQLKASRALRNVPFISPKSKAGQRAVAVFGVLVATLLFALLFGKGCYDGFTQGFARP